MSVAQLGHDDQVLGLVLIRVLHRREGRRVPNIGDGS